jgi:acyl-CoA oxidase
MDSMHHVLAGLKALFSEQLMVNIDAARRACGGAGFSSNSGFTEIYQNAAPVPTYEGDNTVMMGQAVRYLTKLVKKAKKNEKLPFPFEYLNSM